MSARSERGTVSGRIEPATEGTPCKGPPGREGIAVPFYPSFRNNNSRSTIDGNKSRRFPWKKVSYDPGPLKTEPTPKSPTWTTTPTKAGVD
ncbi:putative dynein heavy chain 2 [Anopheles sinensis]|uniref:Putative dynein heavy chain 2 n=1 Tax=Anopheles sinensis TaxID=74873 RepID=A0A084VR57_ANOSI|nr:putative dynein heavy chain 2 [Anopheles sinensis]